MKSDYLAIFEKRGQLYDQAMQKFPTARDAEFFCLLENIDINNVQRVLDVPSGGGYLARFFPDNVEIHSLEPCQQFSPKLPHLTTDIDLETLLLPPNAYDLVVCQAAIHHVKDKALFFAQCYRALQEQGILCVGDIHGSNPITSFLDTFAGAHNGTGHEGYYLTPEKIEKLASDTGFNKLQIEEKDCHWIFNNHADMLLFCRLLFGLVDVSDAELLNAIDAYIGSSEGHDQTRLHWKMLYATLQKA